VDDVRSDFAVLGNDNGSRDARFFAHPVAPRRAFFEHESIEFEDTAQPPPRNGRDSHAATLAVSHVAENGRKISPVTALTVSTLGGVWSAYSAAYRWFNSWDLMDARTIAALDAPLI